MRNQISEWDPIFFSNEITKDARCNVWKRTVDKIADDDDTFSRYPLTMLMTYNDDDDFCNNDDIDIGLRCTCLYRDCPIACWSFPPLHPCCYLSPTMYLHPATSPLSWSIPTPLAYSNLKEGKGHIFTPEFSPKKTFLKTSLTIIFNTPETTLMLPSPLPPSSL